METITVTKRIINGKEVFNKRFDDYETGYYGQRISKEEFEMVYKIKVNHSFGKEKALDIVERYSYDN
ncbi:MAG: hypothetical protein GY739_18615 [Mesoflavibacter sp.]|nr:hypothetical protein [Mesoflavibacter sp.]